MLAVQPIQIEQSVGTRRGPTPVDSGPIETIDGSQRGRPVAARDSGAKGAAAVDLYVDAVPNGVGPEENGSRRATARVEPHLAR